MYRFQSTSINDLNAKIRTYRSLYNITPELKVTGNLMCSFTNKKGERRVANVNIWGWRYAKVTDMGVEFSQDGVKYFATFKTNGIIACGFMGERELPGRNVGSFYTEPHRVYPIELKQA